MERQSLVDNAKFLLIFLVVFGHLIEPLKKDSTSMQTIYYWIYIFHMPAFIFLSGFFAKGYWNLKYIIKLMKKMIVPYIIFQLIFSVVFYFFGDKSLHITFIEPLWSLWFLLSLFCWHIMLTMFKHLPPLIGILLAVLIGIVVGYVGKIEYTLSLSRTLVFFPFFLIGYWITKDQLLKLKLVPMKIIGISIFISIFIAIMILPSFSTYWLLGSQPYEAMGYPTAGGFFRLGLYGLAILMGASFFAIIPSNQLLISKLGQRTLYVYLLHGIFIQYFRHEDLFQYHNIIDLIGFIVVSIVIVFLLSSKFCLTIFQPLIEVKISRMKRAWKAKYSTLPY